MALMQIRGWLRPRAPVPMHRALASLAARVAGLMRTARRVADTHGCTRTRMVFQPDKTPTRRLASYGVRSPRHGGRPTKVVLGRMRMGILNAPERPLRTRRPVPWASVVPKCSDAQPVIDGGRPPAAPTPRPPPRGLRPRIRIKIEINNPEARTKSRIKIGNQN